MGTELDLREADREAFLQVRRRRRIQRMIGRPALLPGDDPLVLAVRRKVRAWHARGMTFQQMSQQTGIPYRTVSHIHYRNGGMRRSNLDALARMEFEEPAPDSRVSATGPRRRLLALWADGFTYVWIADHLEGDATRIGVAHLASGRKGVTSVTYATARRVAALYDKVAAFTAEEAGVDPVQVGRVRGRAGRKQVPPRSCWDPDTIDDPQAVPQWTGHCGALLGVYLHQRDGIPECPACRKIPGRRDGVNARLMRHFDPDKLAALREAAGLSPGKLCEIAGLADGTVYYWETGRSRPQRRGVLESVLSVLDATIEDVITEREDDCEGRP